MDNRKACTRCGEMHPPAALGCSKCGQPFVVKMNDDLIPPAQKSPSRAFFLSFAILAGFGQFYVGQVWKGIVWMLIAILVGVPTLGIGTLIANAVSGFDAMKVARKLSRGEPSDAWDWFPN